MVDYRLQLKHPRVTDSVIQSIMLTGLVAWKNPMFNVIFQMTLHGPKTYGSFCCLLKRFGRSIAPRWKQCQDHWGGRVAATLVFFDICSGHVAILGPSWGEHWTYKTFQACWYRPEGRESPGPCQVGYINGSILGNHQLDNKFCLHNAPRTELAMSCVEVVLWTPPMDSKGAAGEILPKLSKLLPWKFSCCGWNHVVGCFPTEKSVGLFFIPPKNVIPILFWKNRGLTFPLV